MSSIAQATSNSRSSFLVAWTVLVGAASIAMISLLPSANLLDNWASMLGLLLLAVVAGPRTIRFPGLKVQATVSDLYVFGALFALPSVAVPLVALAATCGAVLGPGHRPFSLRTVFNLFAVPMSAGVAAFVFQLIPSTGSAFGPALVAAIVFHALNAATVSVAIRLETGRGLATTLRAVGGWSTVACLASLFAAGGLYLALEGLGPIGLIPGMSVILPISSFLERAAQAG